MSDAYIYTTPAGDHLRIEEHVDGFKVLVRDGQMWSTVTAPPEQRLHVAQALAGDEYAVVPATATVWRCARCGGTPPTHAEGGSNDTCLYEPVLSRQAEAQAAQPDRPDLRERLTKTIAEVIHVLHGNAVDRVDPEADAVAIADVLVSGFDFVAQPDRPEPVDPASVRVGDIVDYETTVEYRMCRIMGEVEQTAEHVTGEDGRSLKIHGHWWNCNIATVRILQRPEPVPDEAAVEALRDAMVSTSDIVTDPESGDYSITDWARELIRSGVVEVVIPDE